MSGRINRFRMQANPFLRDKSDTRDEFPFIIISCEGDKTEYQYFQGIARAIKNRQYQCTDVVVKILPLPRTDSNSDPASVIDLLEEFWEENSQEYDGAILAAVIDRDQYDVDKAIKRCREYTSKEIQLFVSSPCFEFFLLLHLCDDIESEYDIEKIKTNEKISANNTYVGKIVSELTHARKSIHFTKDYLDNIPRALINAQKYELDIEKLSDSIGTNLPYFFEMLSGVRKSMWNS